MQLVFYRLSSAHFSRSVLTPITRISFQREKLHINEHFHYRPLIFTSEMRPFPSKWNFHSVKFLFKKKKCEQIESDKANKGISWFKGPREQLDPSNCRANSGTTESYFPAIQWPPPGQVTSSRRSTFSRAKGIIVPLCRHATLDVKRKSPQCFGPRRSAIFSDKFCHKEMRQCGKRLSDSTWWLIEWKIPNPGQQHTRR